MTTNNNATNNEPIPRINNLIEAKDNLMTTSKHTTDNEPATSMSDLALEGVIPITGLPPSDDPFDPRNLRVSQDFAAAVPVKKVINTIIAEKPGSDSFFRAHPDPAFQVSTLVLEVKEPRREVYLVAPALRLALASDLKLKMLVVVITRDDNVRIWPISMPDATGRSNSWSESAFDAVHRSQKCWVRVISNMSNGGYDVLEALGDLSEPNWPDLTPKQVLEIAFRGRYIDHLDHPVLRRLRGVI